MVPVDTWRGVGITPAAVIAAGGIRRAPVKFDEHPVLGRWFEFVDDGLVAWLVPSYRDEVLIDVVAFLPNRPAVFAPLSRRAWALGADRAMSPNRIGDDPDRLPPVRVYRTPLAWLRGSTTEGLVILDAERARDELWHVGRIAGEDVEHGHELQRLMRPPRWPGEVLVPQSKGEAA